MNSSCGKYCEGVNKSNMNIWYNIKYYILALELSIALFDYNYEVKSYDLCVCAVNLLKQQQQLQTHIKNKRPPVKNVATQKETSSSGPENRSKIVLLVDASQQTGNFFLVFWVYEITRTTCRSPSFLKEGGLCHCQSQTLLEGVDYY